MLKIVMTVVLAFALFGSTASLAKQDSTNGAPFQALNELIQANEDRILNNENLILQNATAINVNATSIAALEVQAALTLDAIGVLEARIVVNEGDIVSLKSALVAANGDIAALDTQIADLRVSVDASIDFLTSEIDTLKASIAILTASLDGLRATMVEAVGQLDAAISANSDDLVVLTATVASMDAKITLVNTTILGLIGRIDAAEATIVSQGDAITLINSQISAIAGRVTILEGLHVVTREYTVFGTSGLDVTVAQFRAGLSSLNLQHGDFLLVKGIGSQGTKSFCTSNTNVIDVVNNYIADVSDSWYGEYLSDTWINAGSSWQDIYYIYVNAYDYYDSLDFYGYDTSYNWVENYVIPDYYDSYYGGSYEVYANNWDYYSNNSITYKAGTTKLETCGF